MEKLLETEEHCLTIFLHLENKIKRDFTDVKSLHEKGLFPFGFFEFIF